MVYFFNPDAGSVRMSTIGEILFSSSSVKTIANTDVKIKINKVYVCIGCECKNICLSVLVCMYVGLVNHDIFLDSVVIVSARATLILLLSYL